MGLWICDTLRSRRNRSAIRPRKGPRGKSACLHSTRPPPPTLPHWPTLRTLKETLCQAGKQVDFRRLLLRCVVETPHCVHLKMAISRLGQRLMWGGNNFDLIEVGHQNKMHYSLQMHFVFPFCAKTLSKATKYGSLSFEHTQLQRPSQTSCCKKTPPNEPTKTRRLLSYA